MAQQVPYSAVNFSVSVRGTDQTRKYVTPTLDGQTATIDGSQVLYNKTLEAPKIINPTFVGFSADSTSSTQTGDYTITDDDGFGVIYANALNPTITLPTAADNTDRQIAVQNIHSTGWAKVDAEGSETINGLTAAIPLYTRYDWVIVKSDGTEWYTLDHMLRLDIAKNDGNYIGRSDWTNVHIGSVNVTYGSLSGTFDVGEKVTGGSSSAEGVILTDSGSVLVLKEAGGSGEGNFTSGETITGASSAATATVSANTKNVDTNIYHGYGLRFNQIDHWAWFNDTNFYQMAMYSCFTSSFTGQFGASMTNVDTNNFKWHSAVDGMISISDGGGINAINTQDGNYAVSLRVREWK